MINIMPALYVGGTKRRCDLSVPPCVCLSVPFSFMRSLNGRDMRAAPFHTYSIGGGSTVDYARVRMLTAEGAHRFAV